ncbi:pyruvate, water dikinase regulatory protein [Paenibacillus roseipurpureus]|uniref:Putative pyruvate, phosphate dikinase regulatory protein n=1 Tax=Paenibacillus roseopurpureus TaxID=2918901 RepID=A0AA96LIW4_9BACL|nr:pyruvate, water dikinase regulatory protein [Paenibacillus sp. MBLB1832]WNR42632.1 pyruvate, water dikinase regulatory protein [Paenibacillus sp. MBLB1832]
MGEKLHTIFVCSDAVGETANTVVQATIRQFSASQVQVKRYGSIRTEEEVRAIVEEAFRVKGFIAYTLVLPELREMMRQEANRLQVNAIDIMGPMMQAFIDTFKDSPSRKVGLLYQLDEQYFQRVEAVEFTVNSDDGKDPSTMKQAHIVLLGPSRTSKTPLSIYLAHKGYKVSNYPLVPEVKPPAILYELDPKKLVGLVMSPDQLIRIRTERLKAVGLPFGAKYATHERVEEEIAFALRLYRELGCRIIDVTEKAIEETAGLILAERA